MTTAMLKKNARIAGILYVLLGVIAPVRIMYIPNAVLVAGNAQATTANIASHEGVFRLAMLTDLLAGVLTLLVGFALFRLFRDFDRDLTSVMLVLGGFMVTPIYFFNLLNDAAVVVIAHAPSYLAGFSQPQRDGLVNLFLRLHAYGIVVNEIFWGLWLLPFARLILKSRLLPRWVAVWVFLNGVGYMLLSVLGVLSPRLESALSGPLFPLLFAEVVVMFWLAFGRLSLHPDFVTARAA